MRITVDSVDREEQQLSALLLEIKTAQSEREDARNALKVATSRLEKAKGTLLQLGQDVRELSETIDHHRQALHLRRIQVAGMPPELLRAIFLETIPECWDLWDQLGEGEFSDAEAAMPFALAAVCNRWRTVARTTPQLWTYLGVPVPSSPMNGWRHLRRVELIIKRSKMYPLDVLLPWADCPDPQFTLDACTRSIFAAITSIMDRWKVFEFQMPPAALSIATFAKFRYPTPRLEQVALIGPVSYGTENLPVVFSTGENRRPRRYFPVCPLLNYYDSSYANVFINATTPIQPLPKLCELNISVSSAAALWLWDALRATPALEQLAIWIHHEQDFDVNDHLPTPSSHVDLLRLEWLSVDEITGAWFSVAAEFLRTPSLRGFTGALSTLEVLGQRFFDGPGKIITTLCINEDYGEDLLKVDALHLQLVPSVQTLSLSDVRLDDGFFEPLLATDVVILPRLASLELFGCIKGNKIPIGEQMVQFLRARIAERAENTPARLTTVTIDKNTVLSDFHRAEINYLLGIDKGEEDNEVPVDGLKYEDDTVDLLDVVEGMPADEEEAVMTDEHTDEDENEHEHEAATTEEDMDDDNNSDDKASMDSDLTDEYVPSDEES